MSRSSDLSTFRRTATVLATAVCALVASSLGLSAAFAATTVPTGYAVSINQGNVPTTASAYDSQSCDGFQSGTGDGWLFVASPDDFTSFEADFDQGKVFYKDPNNAPDSANVSFPKPYDHLAVVTPAGWTLQNAYAVLSNAGQRDLRGTFTLSHTCPGAAGSPQPPVTPTAPAPTAALTHSCALGGIQVSLGNTAGTAPADFTVHYSGADHPYRVAAGGTQTFTIPVTEDTTDTVTVAAAGMTTQSDTFARNCTATVLPEQHAINPAVIFETACTTGITATLSNMQVDDTTTDSVTFSITTPSGAVEQVVVGANQITKRSYDFADGTTGTVAVAAPGLATQTKSYAKSCTSVLGEKLTKGTPGTKVTKVTKGSKTPTVAVKGVEATRTKLPMTGAATGTWLRAALLLLVAGCALSLAGRRPYRPRHAR